MLKHKFYTLFFIIISFAFILSGCISPKDKVERSRLLKTENAGQTDLINEINRYARINSLRAKMDLRFEDNSFAEVGIAEKYKSADGEVVVQRPSNIFLKVQIPIIKSDIAQMTSDGEKFRVAILEDGAGGKYRRFVLGTNAADYSKLQESVSQMEFNGGSNGDVKKNVNAFSNLRPQHFTEALLVRPTDGDHIYVQSEMFQDEVDANSKKKSPSARVIRGYYILDELARNANGNFRVSRRFWFDRVGGIRLARQMIYDADGTISSDITYGSEGNLSDTGEYQNLPLRIEVTRPKEKYKMSLTYQTPSSVSVGKTYNTDVFVLKNTWNLPEVDLDKNPVAQPTAAVAPQK